MRNRTFTTRFSGTLTNTATGLTLAALVAFFSPGWGGWQPAAAQTTDIATLPVFATTPPATVVKPNVMMILDDSGSMGWRYMPDEADDFDGKYGLASNQCNGIYYDPNTKYIPPVDSTGASYADQNFNSADIDGFGITSTSKTNLGGNNFRPSGSYTAQPAFYYTYSGTQTTQRQKNYFNTGSTFYTECNAALGTTPTPFTKVVVSSTSGPGGTDERTNFANWYSYYSTRMNMMKSATGLAFNELSDQFRVGFMTLNNNSPSNAGGAKFLNLSDFNATQRASFYNKLYNSVAGSSTPLRGTLAKVGRMYAGLQSSINGVTVTNPVQYACQQNYTILSSDGLWNGSDSAVTQLDGSTSIDNTDGLLARPYNDGTQYTTTIVTPYTTTQDRKVTNTNGTLTKTWSKTTTVIGAACVTPGPPTNTTTAPMGIGNSQLGAIGVSATIPDSSFRCKQLGTSDAWFCRSGSNPLPAVSDSVVTDSGGTTWYLVSDTSGNSNCVTARSQFGWSYSSSAGVCPAQATAGSLVTSTPYTQTETLTGYSSKSTDRYVAKQTTTQTNINGVIGSVGPLSPATPTLTFDSSLTYLVTATASDTCGGVVGPPCPSAGGTWTVGTPSPNNVCVANASLPAAGTSTPVVVSSVYSGPSTSIVLANSGPTAGTPVVTTTGPTGGVADTLADVAQYYYATNLRTTALGNCAGIAADGSATDLCKPNTVPSTDADPAKWQHMTTYTVGLGVRGKMVYSPSYLTDKTGDYNYVLAGTTASASTCSWTDALTVTGGQCNWPLPGANLAANADDLWHAAVNGHGTYFSAADPSQLAGGLSGTLQTISNVPLPGTASAAATTNPKITSTNNYQFSSYFKTIEWSGELIRQTMNLTDGSVPYYDPAKPNPASYDWSAQGLLNAKVYSTRNIYTNVSGVLTPFTWGNLTATQKAFFTTPAISTSPSQYPTQLTGLSQFCSTGVNCISATAQSNNTVATGGAGGEALVNFLRGDRSNEEGSTSDITKFYRHRTHVLGDIVSAQPQYVGAPGLFYSDSGYADFKTLRAGRTPVVYTAANDGMLHAFKADHVYDTSTTPPTLVTEDGGTELWAYIPSFVLPRIYTLADKEYADKHLYSVEGTPTAGAICAKAPASTCAASEWQTILVGGLNGGGTGYYALDVTDPASPKLLWEFTDGDMGYSFGKPQITKLSDGTWVVLLTSGYNNCPRTTAANCVKNGTGDGQGRLYVLNAGTGVQVSGSPISTGAGSASGPSGLNQLLAQVDSNNVTTRAYGGDLLGNLWRFNLTVGSFGAHLLANLKDANGSPQPISVRPQVTTINGFPVVYVGTGRYLGPSDVAVTPAPLNSFYAIKDDLTTTTTYSSIRTNSSFIGQQAVDTVCPSGTDVSICQPGQIIRTVTQIGGSATGSLANKNGWYLDFPASAGEIEFTDPKLVLGTLIFSTSVPVPPATQACVDKTQPSEGDAFGYMLDYLTGGAVGTSSGVIASNLGSGVATSPQIAQLPDGTVVAKFRLSTGQEVSTPLRFGGGGGGTKRISWRELVSE